MSDEVMGRRHKYVQKAGPKGGPTLEHGTPLEVDECEVCSMGRLWIDHSDVPCGPPADPRVSPAPEVPTPPAPTGEPGDPVRGPGGGAGAPGPDGADSTAQADSSSAQADWRDSQPKLGRLASLGGKSWDPQEVERLRKSLEEQRRQPIILGPAPSGAFDVGPSRNTRDIVDLQKRTTALEERTTTLERHAEAVGAGLSRCEGAVAGMTTTHADRIETIEEEVRRLTKCVERLDGRVESIKKATFPARYGGDRGLNELDELVRAAPMFNPETLHTDPDDVYVPRAGDVIAAWNESDHVALAVWRRVVINDKEYLPAYDSPPWPHPEKPTMRPLLISDLAQPVRFVRFATQAERVAVGLAAVTAGQAPKAEPKPAVLDVYVPRVGDVVIVHRVDVTGAVYHPWWLNTVGVVERQVPWITFSSHRIRVWHAPNYEGQLAPGTGPHSDPLIETISLHPAYVRLATDEERRVAEMVRDAAAKERAERGGRDSKTGRPSRVRLTREVPAWSGGDRIEAGTEFIVHRWEGDYPYVRRAGGRGEFILHPGEWEPSPLVVADPAEAARSPAIEPEEHPSPVRVVVDPEPAPRSSHSLTLRELIGQTMFLSLSGAVRDRHLMWARLEPASRRAYLAAADAVLELMTDDSLAAKRPTSPARREIRLGDIVRMWDTDWIVTMVYVDGTLDGTCLETLGKAKGMRSTFMGIPAGECRYVRESTTEERVEAGVSVEREAAQAPRPRVVCLCGSTRFKGAFADATKRLSLAGKIVLSVACFPHTDDGASPEEALGEDAKRALDELHKRKIDMADEVLVLNVGGYIGESTRSEIQYAWDHEKPVMFLEPMDTATSAWAWGKRGAGDVTPAAAQSAEAWGGKRRADVCCPSCGSEKPEERRMYGNINDRYPCRDTWHGAEKKEPVQPSRPEWARVTPAKSGSRTVRLLADVPTPDGLMRKGTVAWVSNWDATTGQAIIFSAEGKGIMLHDDQWEAMP